MSSPEWFEPVRAELLSSSMQDPLRSDNSSLLQKRPREDSSAGESASAGPARVLPSTPQSERMELLETDISIIEID